MSALAGLWHPDGSPGAGKGCAAMLRAQAIYGPDASDLRDDGAVALGRNLFRTLPEDRADRQPLRGGGGRWTMVADVRLDNREDLAAALGIAAADARESADSALLLAAWERWGTDCFDRLVGDYAFAVWDAAERRLVLARDPLGPRPLHYHRGRELVAFATMAKGLHALPAIPRAPDELRVAEELALLPDHGPRSFFAGIDRVEPGCWVTIDRDTVRSQRHWNPTRRVLRLASTGDYAEALRAQLDQAVRAQLRGADGAVATQLSAGLDSSIVTTSAALQIAPGTVTAFTAVPRTGYDGAVPSGSTGDEGPAAARTAALYPNITHVPVAGRGRSPLDDLDRHFFLFERPVLNLCNRVWIDAINDAARARGLRVMLGGAMGNMTISYDGMPMLPALIGQGRWLRWWQEARGVRRHRGMRWRGVAAASVGPWVPGPVWSWLHRRLRGHDTGLGAQSALRDDQAAALLVRAGERGLDPHYRPHRDGFAMRQWVMRRIDRGNSAKGTLAGWGIDLRDPTADRRLIEFCLSVPEELFLARGEPKALARAAFGARLPPDVASGRIKGLQAADWHEGLSGGRAALADEVARLAACDPAARTIDLARLARLVADWPDGGWESEAVVRSYRLMLLRAVSGGHFIRRASGSNA